MPLTPGTPPEISPTKNHTATLVGRDVYIFGGYDGLKNHSDLYVFNVDTMRRPPGEGITLRTAYVFTLLVWRQAYL